MKQQKQEGILDVIKLIVIILILTVISALVYAKFFMNKTPSNRGMAEELHKSNPTISVAEYEQTLNEPLAESQKQALDVVFADMPTDIDKLLDDDDPNDNIVTFVDTEGNVWETEIDPEAFNMTDEEADAATAQILAELASEDYSDYEPVNIDANIQEPSLAEDEAFDNWDSEDGFDGVYTGDEGIEANNDALINSGLTIGDIKESPNPNAGKTQEQLEKEWTEIDEANKDLVIYGG